MPELRQTRDNRVRPACRQGSDHLHINRQRGLVYAEITRSGRVSRKPNSVVHQLCCRSCRSSGDGRQATPSPIAYKRIDKGVRQEHRQDQRAQTGTTTRCQEVIRHDAFQARSIKPSARPASSAG